MGWPDAIPEQAANGSNATGIVSPKSAQLFYKRAFLQADSDDEIQATTRKPGPEYRSKSD